MCGPLHSILVEKCEDPIYDIYLVFFRTRRLPLLGCRLRKGSGHTVRIRVTSIDGDLIVPTPYLRVAICPGTPYDDDRRFRGVLNAWLEDNRGIGRIRELIVADLTKFGLEPGDLPPEVSF